MSAKAPLRVLHWDAERDIGNSLIVTLAHGFAFEPHEDERVAEHVRGFDTVRHARNAVKAAKPCSCARCRDRL
jgi:hypothetical protein